MGTLDIRDGADEVRVAICGNLTDSRVEELFQAWQRSMSHIFWRRFVVNLSDLTGYDAAGHASPASNARLRCSFCRSHAAVIALLG